jgi:hypothetical protein
MKNVESLNNLEKSGIIPKKLSEIQPITESRNIDIKNREDLENIIEYPLLSACQELYDKNIQTLSSSANQKDVAIGHVYISINFDTLSDKNKEIGRSLGEVHFSDEMNILKIEIPINEESSVEDIKNEAENIAHKFEKQQYSVVTYTIQDLRGFYGIDRDDESFGPESFSDYYWSSEHKLFFLSEEQFKKATE